MPGGQGQLPTSKHTAESESAKREENPGRRRHRYISSSLAVVGGGYLLALVRSDQASEPTVARAYIGELPRHDREARVRAAIAHEVVFCRVEIRARRAVEV